MKITVMQKDRLPVIISQYFIISVASHALKFSNPLTASDVLVIDLDVIVSVWSALLMPSSKGVKYFMDNDSFVFTLTAYGYNLASCTCSSNIRITSVKKIKYIISCSLRSCLSI